MTVTLDHRSWNSDTRHVTAGDCWFVAAVACLAVSPKQLLHRVVPANQYFHNDYAGNDFASVE